MNENEYTLKLSRLEVCDLMQACTHIVIESRAEMENDSECPEYRKTVVLPGTIAKWQKLHDKVEKQLDGQDANSIFAELKAQYDDGKITKEELQTEMGRRIGFLF